MDIEIDKHSGMVAFSSLKQFELFVDSRGNSNGGAVMIKIGSCEAVSLHTLKMWPYNEAVQVRRVKKIKVEI